MSEPLRLLCLFAHPDDETFGLGPTLAAYATAGVETYLVTATRGERGWQGAPEANPGHEALGRLREAELNAAAQRLGLSEVRYLGYLDGDLDQAEPQAAIAAIVAHIRRVRPQVIVTFAPDGAYGHPDHIAISQLALAAIVCAADRSYADPERRAAHRVAKLYFLVDTEESAASWYEVIGDFNMPVDGEPRSWVLWPGWAVSARIDGVAHSETVWEAFLCHRSQCPPEEVLARAFTPESWPRWAVQSFYRAMSTVNSGRTIETDLFEGLR